jgi:hypothetical protein
MMTSWQNRMMNVPNPAQSMATTPSANWILVWISPGAHNEMEMAYPSCSHRWLTMTVKPSSAATSALMILERRQKTGGWKTNRANAAVNSMPTQPATPWTMKTSL